MPTSYDVRLLQKKEIAEGTMEFTLEKPKGFEYRAGQYGDLVLPPSTGLNDSNNKHGFSFVSAPFEDTLRMATRMRDSLYKRAAAKVPEGTMVQLLALWGDFTLQKNEAVPVVFITGGIGITPVRSIIAQATHDKTNYKITLIYANRTPAQAAYTDDLKWLAGENKNFTFVPVYTSTQGHVNAELIKQHVPDIIASRYYLSGPEGMVKAMRALLIEIGADEDNIRTEEFEGY
ncbi:Ferredoxin-NADP reductase [Nitrosomonas eutropha]|uniref:FAD-dependent oxidoreductase n=1 Tax=Nitrosomonas TaxID=914 RepID=UPI00089BE60D|nr:MULTISPECIES: FAD-dependent oxidoreductase [Nitrosomonas]MXS79851.1 oxidoreductase [Nitrosomonas sp. GH22]SDW49105.1 Ferredoxin-NADP reductase [Nitrosomonas eutropha]